MNAAEPQPLTQHRQHGRVTAQGRPIYDGSVYTLLVIHEADGSWSFHGLGAFGATLSKADTAALSGPILAGAR